MKYAKLVLAVLAGMAIMAVFTLRAQQPKLTALDYFEIEQLMFRYGQAIDSCSNNGYDYADLYTADGTFTDNFTEEGFKKGGLVRAKGREALARAAGGGTLGCKDVGWKDWSHLMLNPVIPPQPRAEALPDECTRWRLARKGRATCNASEAIRMST